MKKILSLAALAALILSYAAPAMADGCYMCSGGTYVQYSGSDDATKRKAAKACGCEITGTRGDCSAANLKVLCSVQNESDDSMKLAACDTEEKITLH